MKRFYAILLTVLLLGGMGFPLISQVNPQRSVMEAPEKIKIKLSENRLTIENSTRKTTYWRFTTSWV